MLNTIPRPTDTVDTAAAFAAVAEIPAIEWGYVTDATRFVPAANLPAAWKAAFLEVVDANLAPAAAPVVRAAVAAGGPTYGLSTVAAVYVAEAA